MITYWEIKYKMNDPDQAGEFAGVKTANIVAPTRDEAVDNLICGLRSMRPEIVGEPVRKEMSDEEYANG